VLAALGFCQGCGEDDPAGEDVDRDVMPIEGLSSGAMCPEDSDLSYANFGRQFIASYCLRCHSEKVTGSARVAPADRNFDDLAAIRDYAEAIDRQAGAGPKGANRAMPPEAPVPTLEQREQLGEWLACGVRMGHPDP
jgi:uncharacterized membrane protein